MDRRFYLGDDLLLTAAEAAEALGETEAAVEGLAAAGRLTWETCGDGRRRYPQGSVAALAALRAAVPAPPAGRQRMLTRGPAARLLGISPAYLARLTAETRVPARRNQRGWREYPEDELLALRDSGLPSTWPRLKRPGEGP